MLEKSKARYAIYFAPAADSVAWQLGSAWLGRDAYRQENVMPALSAKQQQVLSSEGEDWKVVWRSLTQAPRHYGLHATLKAPFYLHSGRCFEQLDEALQRLAKAQRPLEFAVQLSALRGFLALLPATQVEELNHLAAQCVLALDAYRQPITAAELLRRRQAALSPQQEALLLRWGYPHVFDEFIFHLTLTKAVPPALQVNLQPLLADYFAPTLASAWRFDSFCLFEQPEPDCPFVLIRRYPFGVSERA